jgi:hypothetical protein
MLPPWYQNTTGSFVYMVKPLFPTILGITLKNLLPCSSKQCRYDDTATAALFIAHIPQYLQIVTRNGRPGQIFHRGFRISTIAYYYAYPHTLQAVETLCLALSNFHERLVYNSSDVHYRTVRPEGIAVDIAMHRCLRAKV